MGGLFSLYIFEKPIGYITSILTSNSTSKWVGPVIMLFYFFLGFTSATQVEEYPIVRNFGEERYATFNNRPHRTFDFNYENLRNKEMRIFTPVISADVIQDPILKLFIPIIDREEEAVGLENVSFWEKINRSSATRDSMQREDLKKYAAFNQVFINKKSYSDIEFQYYHHPNAGEFGLLSYISSDQFQEGKNLIEIKKNYFYQDSIQKIVAIPFYFELK